MSLKQQKALIHSSLDEAAYSVVASKEWKNGQLKSHSNCVAEEMPVALEYNKTSHAVMLVSPQNLEDFALGFSLSEGIIQQASDIHEMQLITSTQGITIRLTIALHCFKALKDRRRNLTGRTGCGLCGIESLEQMQQKPATVPSSDLSFSLHTLHQGFRKIKTQQELRECTGATHAAAWMDNQGKITLIREDVGRHNALDKLYGALITMKQDLGHGAALITSRASYEMVQKSAMLGVGIVAAISAPTGLAIRMAESSGITLAGFVRDDRMTVYTHSNRLTLDA